MNEQEALALITYVGEKWGAAAAIPTDSARVLVRVQVWMDALADVDAGTVRAALASCDDEYPPNVVQLRRRIEELVGARPEVAPWDDFWRWVKSESSRATIYLYPGSPELVCPWPALVGLITVADLAQWARDELSAADLEMIVQAHVRRRFEARMRTVDAGISETPAVAAWRDQVALAAGDAAPELTELADRLKADR